MNFSYRFPVVRGKQGNNEYYIAMIPLKMISKLFPNDEEYVAPEFRGLLFGCFFGRKQNVRDRIRGSVKQNGRNKTRDRLRG